MKVDSANGIFVRVLSLETDPFLGEIDYSLIEANDLAIIKADPNSKDAFFVTPVSKKLKAKELNKIQLEVWIKFNSKVNDLYIPVLKTGKEEENLYDKAGEVIPENAMWKKLRDVYTFRIDKIKISEYWISVIQ
ncbi:MAG: hypothetical protein NVV82_24245 [Sporocytophaga sp.]|nr:hypothetical protein [Sporocytophaga sp.]